MRDTFIQHAISKKLDYSTPYYGKLGDVMQTQTDFDNFPYNRFFVSKYDSPYPTVYDRNAGYRVLNTPAYRCPRRACNDKTPDLCFSAASTTVYPCYPPYFYEYADQVARNNALNRRRVNTSV